MYISVSPLLLNQGKASGSYHSGVFGPNLALTGDFNISWYYEAPPGGHIVVLLET